ncbi:uncharacterized protein LOC127865109 [Dreissena polymorpha]|uniref:Uncharacterized protein n=1 Tax=Dreissena polymorpha TaxID=45954 RepID=A0A9D4MSA3_DREPO|nr:uncharacterized protein LOC127865109 [Dreissena polymorpha]XP_052260975.1 uncharacterized protein LOC127865109 [Dreissena polymorpha]KAH3880856.1 hypothetical protein DPMN_004778 [Dreissena polymorpha]
MSCGAQQLHEEENSRQENIRSLIESKILLVNCEMEAVRACMGHLMETCSNQREAEESRQNDWQERQNKSLTLMLKNVQEHTHTQNKTIQDLNQKIQYLTMAFNNNQKEIIKMMKENQKVVTEISQQSVSATSTMIEDIEGHLTGMKSVVDTVQAEKKSEMADIRELLTKHHSATSGHMKEVCS